MQQIVQVMIVINNIAPITIGTMSPTMFFVSLCSVYNSTSSLFYDGRSLPPPSVTVEFVGLLTGFVELSFGFGGSSMYLQFTSIKFCWYLLFTVLFCQTGHAWQPENPFEYKFA